MPRVQLSDRVKNDLVKLIARRQLKPGDKLPTLERLCEEFSVSRTVVREAIVSLKAEGSLRSRRGSGVFVSEPPKQAGSASPMFMQAAEEVGAILDLMELRLSVEVESAGLAAERRTETDLLRMAQALDRFETGRRDKTLSIDADRSFHAAIADATNNKRFRMFLDEMGSRMIPRQALQAGFTDEASADQFLSAIRQEHLAIYEAIEERDATAARAAMRRHLETGRRRYRELLQALPPRATP